jgi:hypothetical protein
VCGAIFKTTQNVVILSNEDFDEVVREDLQLIKQVLANMKKVRSLSLLLLIKVKRKPNNWLGAEDI